jgi:hypothetical protein
MSEHRKSVSEGGTNPTGAAQKGSTNGPNTFLSTTKREDFWKNSILTPFTKPTSFENPGPGKYNHEKKKDDIKTKILMEETLHVPFSSSCERECNRRPNNKHLFPGPGTYIDINNP